MCTMFCGYISLMFSREPAYQVIECLYRERSYSINCLRRRNEGKLFIMKNLEIYAFII